jgi:DNA-binding transcriptional ArsR family regulator
MFMMSAGVDEYKASEISLILNKIKQMRNNYGCAFCVVHHYRKGAGEAHERVYGSMALYAWSENSLFVSRRAGTSTIIDIDRDIKDAIIEESLSVDFKGSDRYNEYHKVILNSITEQRLDAAGLMLRYIKESAPKDKFTRGELAIALDVSDKTVTRAVKALSGKGMVTVDYDKSKNMIISPGPGILGSEAVFGI